MISVYDLMQKYISCDEETLKEIFVEDVWDWRDVDSQIEIIKIGDEFDKMPASEKTAIMKSVLNSLDSEARRGKARRGEVLAKVADKLREWLKLHDTKSVDEEVKRLLQHGDVEADILVFMTDEDKIEILRDAEYDDCPLQDQILFWYQRNSLSLKQLYKDYDSEQAVHFVPCVFGSDDVYFRNGNLPCEQPPISHDDRMLILAKAIKANSLACRTLIEASIKVELQKWAEEHKAKEVAK